MYPSSEKVIEKFYLSFQQKDFKGMQACYHPAIEFSDEVFQSLKGKQAAAMWHMLLSGSDSKPPELKIIFSDIRTGEDSGSCDWEAFYTFTRTGRNVHNKIHASFVFRDGLIIRHTDAFDFWKWSRMAFGLPGLLFGWTGFFRNKVRKEVAKRLSRFISKNSQYAS